MTLSFIVLILIILLGTLFFIIGILFSIFLFYNSKSKESNEILDEDIDNLEEIIENNGKKIEFKHLYFL